MNYLDVSPEAGARYFGQPQQGPIVMLNMLRFREQAVFPEGKAPGQTMTGEQAYQLYIKHTAPLIKKSGGEVLFYGTGAHFLIGPEAERWDMVLLVRHHSQAQFLAFAKDEEYLRTAYYRKAGLEDSRLLPLTVTSS